MKWCEWMASLVVLVCLCAGPSMAQETPPPSDVLNLLSTARAPVVATWTSSAERSRS